MHEVALLPIVPLSRVLDNGGGQQAEQRTARPGASARPTLHPRRKSVFWGRVLVPSDDRGRHPSWLCGPLVSPPRVTSAGGGHAGDLGGSVRCIYIGRFEASRHDSQTRGVLFLPLSPLLRPPRSLRPHTCECPRSHPLPSLPLPATHLFINSVRVDEGLAPPSSAPSVWLLLWQMGHPHMFALFRSNHVEPRLASRTASHDKEHTAKRMSAFAAASPTPRHGAGSRHAPASTLRSGTPTAAADAGSANERAGHRLPRVGRPTSPASTPRSRSRSLSSRGRSRDNDVEDNARHRRSLARDAVTDVEDDASHPRIRRPSAESRQATAETARRHSRSRDYSNYHRPSPRESTPGRNQREHDQSRRYSFSSTPRDAPFTPATHLGSSGWHPVRTASRVAPADASSRERRSGNRVPRMGGHSSPASVPRALVRSLSTRMEPRLTNDDDRNHRRSVHGDSRDESDVARHPARRSRSDRRIEMSYLRGVEGLAAAAAEPVSLHGRPHHQLSARDAGWESAGQGQTGRYSFSPRLREEGSGRGAADARPPTSLPAEQDVLVGEAAQFAPGGVRPSSEQRRWREFPSLAISIDLFPEGLSNIPPGPALPPALYEQPVPQPPSQPVSLPASIEPSSVPLSVPPSSGADGSVAGHAQGPNVVAAAATAMAATAADLYGAQGAPSMPPLLLPLPPRAPQLRQLDTSAVDVIGCAAAAATWVHAPFAADVDEALHVTFPAICAQAATDEASHGEHLRQLDEELVREKNAIEAHVHAFGSALATRYEMIALETERRAAQQAEVDKVVAYLVRLLELNASLDLHQRRLHAAVAAEEAGTTASDHADRVRADEMALRGLVAERERLGDTCPICHDLLGVGSAGEVARLRCRHRFHAHCLADWAESCTANRRTPSCPLCRGPLASPTATAGT